MTSSSTPKNTDEHWMERALELAAMAASKGEVPVGAVVVLDGREVGAGFNAPITGCDPTAHAEIRALRDAASRVGNYRLSGATLYVTLEPCTMCVGAVVHSRVSRLVYGAIEPKAGAVESTRRTLDEPHLNWNVSSAGGVLQDRCSQMLSDFFSARRKEIRQRRKAIPGKGISGKE
ncbi:MULTISPECIES: tRNA adenosine(34) deaminase TadA [Marinobacter]|uniref:tRNA-specific adenosine deaminase n=1 Tax=Marinobacter suaedae TaxID=3057675 RepID=A0ABT8W2J4_9GAMM|nr:MULTISPECIES: tRNA adenosine(34) deaminase TadA [unclassified Marinobacter]MBZ2167804.1 tRNA adenosine(34) deaminase TadA [Marinobacter sp. F4216]MDO3722464.1 tRNA adenosine(34) deaminase TadA [Marinobacter sp. chi1]